MRGEAGGIRTIWKKEEEAIRMEGRRTRGRKRKEGKDREAKGVIG